MNISLSFILMSDFAEGEVVLRRFLNPDFKKYKIKLKFKK